MQTFAIPQWVADRVIARQGKLHPYDRFEPKRTALVVVDMQNYFVAPGYQGEAAAAREIVGNINRLAKALRDAGGTVIWIQTASDNADKSWSHHHGVMLTPERSARRLRELKEGGEGYALYPALDAQPEDPRVLKRRYSAMIQGSSNLEQVLRSRGIDMLLVAGTSTSVCCESTARDAMMLDFKCVMVSDCLAAFSQIEHQNSLESFLLFFGDVLTTDETIARLKPATVAA